MPGIFGAIGGPPLLSEILEKKFSAVWKGAQSVRVAGGVLGGHAFDSKPALYRTDYQMRFAVDGEASLYRSARSFEQEGRPELYHHRSGQFELTAACRGNVAVVNERSRIWYLGCEWSGSFPLYYFHQNGCFAFSSLLRPLANAIGDSIDPFGVLEFLLEYYTLTGRTQFEHIRRLFPGQVLSYDLESDCLQVRETSRLWVGGADRDRPNVDAIARACWETLRDAVQVDLGVDGKHALMMSGGWDSRLLLAAMLQSLDSDRLCAYSHGNLRSREIRLVKSITRSMGIESHQEPLSEGAFDLHTLQRAFARVENILFPDWHHAGAVLQAMGVQCVSSGVYGEVLGGHYGSPRLFSGVERIVDSASILLGWSDRFAHSDGRAFQIVCDMLRYKELKKPLCLNNRFWEAISGQASEAVNADIETTLRRFEKRGVTNGQRLIEAFVSEQRGTQFINSQIISCRAMVDIAIPYAERSLLMLASSIPLGDKFNNLLDQIMLRQNASQLLRFPCSATLIPAAMPIVLQEAVRALRHYGERAFFKLHFATHGRISLPRTSWYNFEFLKDGKVLRLLLDDLQCDIWDREALERSVRELAGFDRRGFIDPHHFLKVYMVDLMLRPSRQSVEWVVIGSNVEKS